MAAKPLTLARLRRDRVAIWLWLPIGGLAMALAIQAWQRFVGEPPPALYKALYIGWIIVTFGLIWRRSSQPCPKCGHRYLRAFPWMSLKKVQCGACGHELA